MVKSIITFITAGLLLLSSLHVHAQKFNEEIYTAYISGKMDQWEKTMVQMKSVYDQTGSREMLYDLVVAQYGYIAYLISVERNKEAREYVKEAEENIEVLLKQNKNTAKLHALLGAVYGFKVKLNPLQAVVYGKRAFDENNLAQELAPEDPQVLVEKGNFVFYKPAIFGPDPLEASKIYQKAIDNFEKDREKLKDNWLYLNAMISMANACIESEQLDKANQTYLKLLKHEPDFKWIRDKVYPDFKKKYGY